MTGWREEGGSAGEDGSRTGNTQPVVFGGVDTGKRMQTDVSD